MDASIWEPVMVGLLAFLALAVVVMAAGALLLWRYGRRKWRAFHSHGAVVGATALWEATASGRFRRSSPMVAADVAHATPRRVRKDLARTVDRAEAAVSAAAEVGAPVASLPFLCRQLRGAAADVDRILSIETGVTVTPEVASQAAEVVRAAADIQAAAVAAASDANGQRVRDLTGEADREIRLLHAGLDAARAVLPTRLP